MRFKSLRLRTQRVYERVPFCSKPRCGVHKVAGLPVLGRKAGLRVRPSWAAVWATAEGIFAFLQSRHAQHITGWDWHAENALLIITSICRRQLSLHVQLSTQYSMLSHAQAQCSSPLGVRIVLLAAAVLLALALKLGWE